MPGQPGLSIDWLRVKMADANLDTLTVAVRDVLRETDLWEWDSHNMRISCRCCMATLARFEQTGQGFKLLSEHPHSPGCALDHLMQLVNWTEKPYGCH